MTEALAVVTSCSGYGIYLRDWTEGLLSQSSRPDEIAILTHGAPGDAIAGAAAAGRLRTALGIPVAHRHEPRRLDFGTARNLAVGMTSSPWVMHADADDILLPHCLEDCRKLMPTADVVALGYEARTLTKTGQLRRTRIYRDLTGRDAALGSTAPCSGLSPFRRSLWERRPYRTDMLGAWDTALWVGFAYLEGPPLRIRATRRAGFVYRQHEDSIFNTRRKAQDWSRAHTEAMLGTLRRGVAGVSLIVPLASEEQPERRRIWAKVRRWYERHFPTWQIVEGFAPGGRAWCKGNAVADALTRATGELLVIADADCLVDSEGLEEAVARVGIGSSPWAVPHSLVYRLGAGATEEYLTKPIALEAVLRWGALDRPAYQGYAGGGILVVPRVGYLACGGFPRSFVGWGSEDQALACILDTCLGKHWRGPADLFHLWHPPQDTKSERSRNHGKLRTLRAQAALGRDTLIAFLRVGEIQPAKVPSWKQKGIALAIQRRDQAIASGKYIPPPEPSWILQAKAVKAAREARRQRDAEGG